MSIADKAREMLDGHPDFVRETTDRMRAEYEDRLARGEKDTAASHAVWEKVVSDVPTLARAILLHAERSGEELMPPLDSEAIMEMIGPYEPAKPSYDYDDLIYAAVYVDSHWQASPGDLGLVAAEYGLDGIEVEAFLKEITAAGVCPSTVSEAMAQGILVGLALVRGERPPEGTALPDWVQKLLGS